MIFLAILGAIALICFGMLVAGLCRASADADRWMEERQRGAVVVVLPKRGGIADTRS